MAMIDFTGWLTIINLIVLISGSIGGTLVFRSSLRKAENDVQERVREALSAENELLQSRINRVEKENRRLNKLIQLIVTVLKKTLNAELEVDGDIVYLRTPQGTHTARIDTTDLSA